MPSGPWLNGPSGRPLAGALGVLVDTVLGYAIMRCGPPGRWSVSAEISIDMCGRIPENAPVLLAEARSDHSDDAGGIASGAVTDASGRLIALFRQHGRWVPIAPGTTPAAGSIASASVAAAETADLTGLLGAPSAADDGAHLDLVVTSALANPLGNLHGGIAMCACDVVAQAALHAVGGPPRTASIHVTYPRPVPVGAAVRFAARVLHRGRAFAITKVTASNESGKPCVIAMVTTGMSA